MWDAAFIGLDQASALPDTAARRRFADALSQQSGRSRLVAVATPALSGQAEELRTLLADAGQSLEVVVVPGQHRQDDFGALVTDLQLAALLDQARHAVVVGGLCTPALALTIDLAMCAAGLRALIRVEVKEQAGAFVLSDQRLLPPARVRADEAFSSAVTAVGDLLDQEQLSAARDLLAVVTETAADAADAVFFSFPGPLELLGLAIRCRQIPPPGKPRRRLADDLELTADQLGEMVTQLVDALRQGDGAAGAAALAMHARRAAGARGDLVRERALAAITQALPNIPDDLKDESTDIAAILTRSARTMLENAEYGIDTGHRAHLVVATGGWTPEAAAAHVRSLDEDDRLLIIGPEAEAETLRSALGTAGATALRLGETTDPAGVALAVKLALSPGDEATVVGARADDVALAVHACLGARSSVRSLQLAGEPAWAPSPAFEEARRRALPRIIARRAASSSLSLEGFAALAERLPSATRPAGLAVARRLASGAPGPTDIEELARLGVNQAVLDATAACLEGGSAEAAAGLRWPRVRRGLATGDPVAASAVVGLLEAHPTASRGVSEAVAAAWARGTDASVADVAVGLGIPHLSTSGAEDLLDDVEDALAEVLRIAPAVLGGPDPSVSALAATGYPDRSGPVDQGRAVTVTVPVAEDLEYVVNLLGPVTPDPNSESSESALRALALAELRREARPGGVWAVDAALAAIELGRHLRHTRVDRLTALTDERAGAALERLTALPAEVLSRGGFGLRDELLPDLQPLREWFEGTPEADVFDRWREEWVGALAQRGLLEERESEHVQVFTHFAGPRRAPAPLAFVEAGLVEAGTHLEIAPGADVTVTLPIRDAVSDAVARAAAAWETIHGPDGDLETNDIERQRAALVLRAVLSGPAVTGWTGWEWETPALHRLRVASLSPTGTAVPVASLEPGPASTLIASLGYDPGAVTVVYDEEGFTPRRALGAALASASHLRVHAAEELLYLARVTGDPQVGRALLLAGAVLLQDDHAEGVEREVARELEQHAVDAGLPRPPLALRTVASDLHVLIRYERELLADAVAEALDVTRFASLDESTRRNRLVKHAPTAAQLDLLDALSG